MHIRATVFRHTFSCLYIPVRHLPGRPLSYSTAFFQKLQQLRRGFRMGKIPSVMCCQETDRHDNKCSDKYRRQSSPLSEYPHTAQCSHEGCTGINMLYEDVGFLSRHHITHQTAAYPGEMDRRKSSGNDGDLWSVAWKQREIPGSFIGNNDMRSHGISVPEHTAGRRIAGDQ